MSGGAGHKHSTRFHCGGCNQQVRVVLGKTAATGQNPKIFCPIEDGVRQGNDLGMATEYPEPCQQGRCLFIFIATCNFKPSDNGQCKLSMQLKIPGGLRSDLGVPLFQQFRQNIGVEQSERHLVTRMNGSDCSE